MDPKNISTKKFTVFMLIAFGAAYVPLCLAGFMNAKGNTLAFMFLFRVIAIAIPFLAVIIARLPLKQIGFGIKTNIRYIITAFIGPQILSWIGSAIFFLIFPESLNLGFTAITDMLPDELSGIFDPSVINPVYYLIVMVIASLTFIPISQIIPSLGEEAGWRGVLYPFLKNRFGTVTGRLIGGALWGIWHWPLIIIGSYFYGKDYLGYPVLGPVMICISLIVFGILIDWLYERTHSIWVASLAHAAMNAASMPMLLLSGDADSKLSVLGPSAFSLIPLIPVIAVSLVISIKGIKESKK
ncbi:MAG: CPBP family intramembrane metalloprotease [Saccharofermentans sp.]|nr:CPBP family intramembrane metalloprotease [Saccharofermentans sp.]